MLLEKKLLNIIQTEQVAVLEGDLDKVAKLASDRLEIINKIKTSDLDLEYRDELIRLYTEIERADNRLMAMLSGLKNSIASKLSRVNKGSMATNSYSRCLFEVNRKNHPLIKGVV